MEKKIKNIDVILNSSILYNDITLIIETELCDSMLTEERCMEKEKKDGYIWGRIERRDDIEEEGWGYG